MKNVAKQVKRTLNESRTITVADVEYEDDDNYTQHVLIQVYPNDTEKTVEDILYDMGLMYVYVNDIYDKVIDNNYEDNFYGVIECLD